MGEPNEGTRREAGAGAAPRGARRRLRALDVLHISLVDAGANRRTVLAKSVAGAPVANVETTVRIAKRDDARRVVYGVVYAPDECDAHGDTMTGEEIEKAAYRFMREARTANVDKQHDGACEHGYVAESWLVREGDALFPDEAEGTWAVGVKVENAETWAAVEAGEITGLSLAGNAETEQLQDEGATMQTQKGERTRRTFLQKLRDVFGGGEGGEAVEKDYAGAVNASAIRQATWTLGDVLSGILGDDAHADPTAAVRESVAQFSAHIDALLGGAQPEALAEGDGAAGGEDEEEKALKKPRNVYRIDVEPSGAGAMRKPRGVQKGAGADAGEDAEQIKKSLAEIAESVAGIGARLAVVEAATPGRQSEASRDESTTGGGGVTKAKGFKGVRII